MQSMKLHRTGTRGASHRIIAQSQTTQLPQQPPEGLITETNSKINNRDTWCQTDKKGAFPIIVNQQKERITLWSKVESRLSRTSPVIMAGAICSQIKVSRSNTSKLVAKCE